MTDKERKGRLGEDYTADFLIKKGCKIIARNYRKPCGEIDILAESGDKLLIVEVKTRKANSLVSGVEAVGYRKKGRIIAAAECYFADNGLELQPRYDIAEVTVTSGDEPRIIDFKYYKDAFDTTGYETQF
ncbi:MAG: YraN family protein [Eubacterium sp.]|nr:YraN family protein [Eubacterium sp.]